MTKRKEAPDSTFEISVKIIDSEIAKNKKMYAKLPEKLQRRAAPSNATHLWFDFGKQWHPLGLFDDKDKLIISKNTVQMEISCQPSAKEEFKPEPYIISAVAAKGVYWFSVSASYVSGSFTYKFTSPGANSLIHVTPIDDGDAVATSKTRVVSEALTTTKPAHVSTKANPKKDSTPISTRVIERLKDDKSEENQSKKVKITEPEEAPLDLDSKIRVVKAAGSGRRLGIGGSSSPVPGGGPRLSQKSRIERPLSSQMFSNQSDAPSRTPQSAAAKVKGPILEITIPAALVIALLDDRARVDSEVLGPIKACKTSDVLEESATKLSLTVSELLNKVQQRAKHSIADCDVVILRVRQLFECLFESCILYVPERLSHKQKIQQLKAEKQNFADYFGGIYLLRLLVLIVTGADSIYPQSSDSVRMEDTAPHDVTSTSVSSALDETVSGVYDVSGTESSTAVSSPTGISQSSKLRRSAVMNKHHKNEFYKFQEVIDCALRELDESAHVIF